MVAVWLILPNPRRGPGWQSDHPCPPDGKRRPAGPKRRPADVRQGAFRVRKCAALGWSGGHIWPLFLALYSQVAEMSANRRCEGEERFRRGGIARQTLA